MKLKAKDTLHVSSVGPDQIQPDQEFEVNDDEGKDLVERGLAVEAKAEKAAPKNKAEPAAPANKSVISAASMKRK
jgi:hypothetical protein